MKRYLTVAVLTILVTSISFAKDESNQPIQAKTAGGESQTIVIDENGNLKTEDAKSSVSTQRAENTPEQTTTTR